jgi:uncharacterized protein (TIGR02231 family)
MLLHALANVPLSLLPADLPTSVSSVTVYPDRALVLRTGEADLTGDLDTFTIGRLPVGIQDDSVRVRVGGGAVVVGVEVRARTDETAVSASVEELRGRRKALAADLAAARDEVAVLEASRDFVLSIRAASAQKASQGIVEGGIDPGRWGEALDFVSTRLASNAQALRGVRERVEKLEAEIAALDARLQSLAGDRLVPFKEVVAKIASGGAGRAVVEVEYLVGGATWRPVYDLRAGQDLTSVALAYRAVVSQRSGEDWSDVDLTLSTARPHLGAAPPPLYAMHLQFPPPAEAELLEVARRRFGEPRRFDKTVGGEKDEADLEAGKSVLGFAATGLAPSAPAVASVEERGISVQFRIPRRETVPSDGEEHAVLVGEAALELTPEYFAAPKAAERVFLTAKTKNTSAFPLLAGLASVFFGPDFVGRAPLGDVQPGDSFDVYLGQDPAITVERKKVREYREGPGFLGSDETITYEYEIRAKNRKTSGPRARVLVKEPVPISRDDRIKVKILEAKPDPLRGEEADREREQDGFWKFPLDLAPGEEKVVRLVYAVSFPKGTSVAGLPK